MTAIVLGTSTRHKVSLDLDVLLRTRLLIQASSGGGKSWLLRRIAEQLFGKVQVLIIDPEGEFATLREKYGYVLVGKGGETPADVRSAGLVAHKLLEVKASAVCDLYELSLDDRHAWVRMFLESMVDAPKELWTPVVVIVDEAHYFAPEKGHGESEASDAMISLATKGRKRGFAPVFATQRLGKLRKDAAADLLNVLVGQTFIDVDRKRAAESLGIDSKDKQSFFSELRMLKAGQFWGLGRAISTERILINVGTVETTHPEAGKAAVHAAAPPPTPEQVKKLLPKLADLPAEAEEKARTEEEYERRVKQLQAEVYSLQEALEVEKRLLPEPPEPEEIIIHIPALTPEDLDLMDGNAVWLEEMGKAAIAASEKIRGQVEVARDRALAAGDTSDLTRHPIGEMIVAEAVAAAPRRPSPVNPGPAPPPAAPRPVKPSAGLTAPQQRILNALAWLAAAGITQPLRVQVAFLAEQSPRSSGFRNNLSALKTAGLLEYRGSGALALTALGTRKAEHPKTRLTANQFQQTILDQLPNPQARILRVLIGSYPRELTREHVARQADQSPASSGFRNNLSALRTLNLIAYRPQARLAGQPILFLG